MTFIKDLGMFIVTRLIGGLAVSLTLLALAASVALGLSVHIM